MNFANPIETLIKAADKHAEDTGQADHAVGDLQDLLRTAWGIMTFDQKTRLLQTPQAADVLETGMLEVDDPQRLVDDLDAELKRMSDEILAADYRIVSTEGGLYYWECGIQAGEDLERADAIVDAYQHLQESETKPL